MRLILLLCFFLFFAQWLAAQPVQVTNLTCEYRTDPLGIDVPKPRLSWQLTTPRRDVIQSAYELRVATDPAMLGKGKSLVWQTGKVSSDQSVHVVYEGPVVQAKGRYYWQVRVWDGSNKPSAWSEPAFWEMGLLNPSDWSAKWIELATPEDTVMRPSPMFRKTFSVSKPIRSARAYLTAQGLYEAHINGKPVGDLCLTPGWTSYDKRLQYQVYDVTNLLKSGDNAIGVMLGSGWFRSHLAFERQKNIYGSKVALLGQVDITYTDGTKAIIGTDESWKTSTDSPVRYSEIYNGETYDARKEKAGWTTVGFNDAGWQPARQMDNTRAAEVMKTLIAMDGPPVRRHETFKVLKIIKTPKGETVIDFGQNLVGWVKLSVSGKAGDQIKLYHAEVLDKAGNFYTDNLRAAKQEIQYTLKGGGVETYEPHFTFQGFRYVRVEGFPGELKPENMTAIVVYSDMPKTGTFTSSNSLLNQLQHNIQWGQQGNFVDVPTDCPQRDERLGWTGDAQVFSRTAMFNRQVGGFFTKWLKDVAADQLPTGSVPFVVPNVLGKGAAGSAGWADVATIIPWNMYLAYGDKRVLEQQYASMKGWVDYMEKNSKNYLWNTGFHFGDWLFYRPDDDNDGRAAQTDKYLIAQAFFAHSTNLLQKAATVLGKTDDATRYQTLLENVKKAFLSEYVTSTGRLVSSSQTAYVLALNFDLLPEAMRAQAADRLVANIKQYNDHLTTGFLGTPYLCHVLTRFGHTDVAYTLLMQDTYPSWLYPVKMGATTIWERWDGQKPDGSFQTPGMNSFNHYAYGAIGDWMYRVMCGIDTDEKGVGYKQIRIAPQPGGGLTTASADLQSPYGPVKSSWTLTDGRINVAVSVPPNTTATVVLPDASGVPVTENGADVTKAAGVKSSEKQGGNLVVTLGSGDYQFSYSWAKKVAVN